MPVYRLQVTYVGYVQAESAERALRFSNDVQEEIPSIEADELRALKDIDPQWTGDHLIYHLGSEYKTISTALNE